MDLKLIKAIWGMTETWEESFRKIKDAGYSGVETPMPLKEGETHFKELLEKYNLNLILQVYTGCEDNEKPYPDDVEAHIVTFEEQVERAKSFNPMLINVQSAKDSMPYDEQLKFFEQSIRIEKELDFPIAHETHRSRAMFTPWTTTKLLKDLPDLHITADFSHWCNVCESMLSDQRENILIAIEHTIHTHGRVGYEQSPQVPDFRAPEYAYALKQHEQWWDEICSTHHANGREYLTFTPEFGPPDYMQTQPYTQQPVVDLWEVCYAMGQRFNKRFTKTLARG